MTAPVPAEPRKLVLATVVAAIVAAIVLVVAILPAEYGIDPTGLGAATGFARLSEDTAAAPVVETPNGTEPAALYRMRATWTLLSLPLAQQEGRVTRGDTEERVVIPLNVANLTSVTATLTWNDTDLIDGQLTEGDMLEISIRAPGNVRSQLVQAKNERGQPGNASVTLNLRSVPFPQANESTGLVIPMAEDRSGIGNWTFIVRLYAAGGLNGSATPDPGQNWTLAITGEAYELDLATQAEREGDRVRITLQPNQGIEYKFIMSPGARMTYRWESTLPVAYDMHGEEEEGKSLDEFTSFRAGTSDGEEGEHVAPFQGRHGWYWANTNAEPVTITLTTTGEYSILGVPR